MYSIEQQVFFFLVLEFHPLKHSSTATHRGFKIRYNVPAGPDAKTIRMLFVKFERAGSMADDWKGNVGPRQTVLTPKNAAKVSRIVQQNFRKSILWIASATDLDYTSTQKILKNSPQLFPYKIQSHQTIPMKAVKQKFDFAKRILTTIVNDGFDVTCI